jgi:cytochrome b6-f complex iron-sulfur subunit
VSASGSGSAVLLTIDASSPLASPGSAALVSSPSGNLLVARTGADAFTALTATCTHEGCTITGFSGQSYVCPCHGSQFSTGGQVLNGPASRSLRQYQTQYANGVLTITG